LRRNWAWSSADSDKNKPKSNMGREAIVQIKKRDEERDVLNVRKPKV
jgi:hypothetical protein